MKKNTPGRMSAMTRVVRADATGFGLALAIIAATTCASSAAFADTLQTASTDASSLTQPASQQVRTMTNWVVQTNDNMNAPFVVIDKVQAQLFLFDRDGTLEATTAVLLGLAKGDVSPPGIGEMTFAEMKPAMRITPAGRFVGRKDVDADGNDVVWVDYDAAVAMHRINDIRSIPTVTNRLARLATATPKDNRISLGCINIPDTFYETYIDPIFSTGTAIVYVLPEIAPLDGVFPIHTAARREDRPDALLVISDATYTDHIRPGAEEATTKTDMKAAAVR